ncbi:hypothetical protein [Hwangdonia lutea]|uniref:STAS/SEC14 domain-containing protein n=1 Tax=Hwangdonia lutea TaxID=3075823 RepID=A0AA97EM54_9FLAO|nr:hypothetical protein [Hwangdonia sp. SCSIO 19198]WOD43842.1 hypothetical protein RNZ46_00950 [Hwangdonia sp. SCSIO 19198]
MKTTLTFSIATIDVYDNYVVSIIKEGVTVTMESNKILEDIAETYFPNKKFVYITHRINSYSVDPVNYTRTSKIENLAGFAVVSKNNVALSNAEIEKTFLKKPFAVFDNLDDAKDWAQSIVTPE